MMVRSWRAAVTPGRELRKNSCSTAPKNESTPNRWQQQAAKKTTRRSLVEEFPFTNSNSTS
jgi:hypothetical protein